MTYITNQQEMFSKLIRYLKVKWYIHLFFAKKNKKIVLTYGEFRWENYNSYIGKKYYSILGHALTLNKISLCIGGS